MTFLAVSQNYWGRGVTPTEAKKNLKKAGGDLRKHVVYESTDPQVYVNDFGQIMHQHGSTTREYSRRGLPKLITAREGQLRAKARKLADLERERKT